MKKDFMILALKQAEKSKETLKCGSVIVINGILVSKAFNSQRSKYDITAHAEINALRKASKKFKNKNLNDAIIYSTCEPCKMCIEALKLAKIKEVIYAVPLKIASGKNLNENYPKITKNYMFEEVVNKLYK